MSDIKNAVCKIENIIFDHKLGEQIDRLRFIRELATNMRENPDFDGLTGEYSAPIHGLGPLLEDVTKAYDAVMAELEALAGKGGKETASATG